VFDFLYAIPWGRAAQLGRGAVMRILGREAAEQAAVRVGEFTLSRTVAGHLDDVVLKGPFKGEAARPFLNSPLTIRQIMQAGNPVTEATGALRYNVPGTFRGSQGAWELVVDPRTNTIFHFNFVTP
jgi:hypothetical protein